MFKFDYGNLYAQMGRKHFSVNKLAKRIGVSQSTLSRRFAGLPFTQGEIINICNALGIPKSEINLYFFDLKVQKTERKQKS